MACDGKESAVYGVLLKHLGNPNPTEWKPAFSQIAWRLHPPETIPAFIVRARTEALPLEQRQEAVDALAFINDPEAARAMVELAFHGPLDIRGNALWWARNRAGNDWKNFPAAQKFAPRQATARNHKEKAMLLRLEKTALDTAQELSTREQAMSDLASSKSGGLRLLDLASRNELPKELFETAARTIFGNPDLGVRALASQYFPRPSLTGKPFPSVPDLLRMRGDIEKGREVFFSSTASCAVCHAYAGTGRDIGPDLTQIGIKFDRAGLFDAILNPSAALTLGYEPWLITLKDGETVSGFIVASGENVILKQTTGEMRTIPAGQITQRRQLSQSIMPDNIALGMTPRELAGLVDFLLDQPGN